MLLRLRRLKKPGQYFSFLKFASRSACLGKQQKKKGRGHFAGKSCVRGTFLKKKPYCRERRSLCRSSFSSLGYQQSPFPNNIRLDSGRGNKNITWLGWKIQTLTIALFRGHFPEFPTFFWEKNISQIPRDYLDLRNDKEEIQSGPGKKASPNTWRKKMQELLLLRHCTHLPRKKPLTARKVCFFIFRKKMKKIRPYSHVYFFHIFPPCPNHLQPTTHTTGLISFIFFCCESVLYH